MAVETAAGSRLYISTTIPASSTDTQQEFEALSYTEVGEVEEIGEFGDQVGQATFTALANRRVRKFKTSYDAGDLTVTVGFDSGDAGQDAMMTALANDFDYAIKVTLDDGSAGSPSSPSTFYFLAKVMGGRLTVSNVDAIVRRNFTLGISSAIVQVDAQ